MLTVLRAIGQRAPASGVWSKPIVDPRNFKIIYVAPMKALASEIVRKMGKRLAWMGILVRELTGASDISSERD